MFSSKYVIINFKICVYEYQELICTYFYAMIAHTTMRTPGWSVKFTCNAPFHPYSDPIYFYVSIQWSPIIIFPVLVWRCWNMFQKLNRSFLSESTQLPFGIMPGSINVAKVKFAKTKNVMTPWYAGTHGYELK